MYNVTKLFDWDPSKNEMLKATGRPTFEVAVQAIKDNILRMDKNPIHPDQYIFIVEIDSYPHVVPFEIRGDIYWLITVYPARKYKR